MDHRNVRRWHKGCWEGYLFPTILCAEPKSLLSLFISSPLERGRVRDRTALTNTSPRWLQRSQKYGPVAWASEDDLTFVAEQVSHHPPSECRGTFAILSSSCDVFERHTSTGSGLVKALRNTNFVALKCFKMKKKTSLPVDVRHSNFFCLSSW